MIQANSLYLFYLLYSFCLAWLRKPGCSRVKLLAMGTHHQDEFISASFWFLRSFRDPRRLAASSLSAIIKVYLRVCSFPGSSVSSIRFLRVLASHC